jgi:hypothetical protein
LALVTSEFVGETGEFVHFERVMITILKCKEVVAEKKVEATPDEPLFYRGIESL